jgi:hypothetical protein
LKIKSEAKSISLIFAADKNYKWQK